MQEMYCAFHKMSCTVLTIRCCRPNQKQKLYRCHSMSCKIVMPVLTYKRPKEVVQCHLQNVFLSLMPINRISVNLLIESNLSCSLLF